MNLARGNHLRLYRHVRRKQKDRFPKATPEGTISDKRSRGRPKKIWEDNIL